MKYLIILFFLSLLAGQLGGISLSPGIVIYLHDITLVMLLAGMGIGLFQKKRIKLNLLVPIGLFIGWAFITLLGNSGRFSLPVLGASSLYLVRWTAYAGLYVFVAGNVMPKFRWVTALYLTGVMFAVLGLLQFIFYPALANLIYLGWDPHFYRVFSTLFDPNFMGLIYVLTMLLGTSFWKLENLRNLLIVSELVTFIAFLLTYSRSSYLAFAVALFYIAIVKKQWKLLLGLLAFAGMIVFLPRVGNILSLTRLDSTLARIGNWQSATELIVQSPLAGHGFNTLRYVQHVPLGEFVSKSAAGVDSSILFILATTGFIGLAIYGYMIVSMMKLGSGNAWYQASFVALLVHSLFVNSAFYPWVLIWFWIVVGVQEQSLSSRAKRGDL